MARELGLASGQGQAVAKITCPTAEVANDLAAALVERRLAACVNVVPGITSVYHWKGEVCRDSEVLLLAKTRSELASQVLEVVAQLHPYDVPEVLWLRVEQGSASYLDWLDQALLGD